MAELLKRRCLSLFPGKCSEAWSVRGFFSPLGGRAENFAGPAFSKFQHVSFSNGVSLKESHMEFLGLGLVGSIFFSFFF